MDTFASTCWRRLRQAAVVFAAGSALAAQAQTRPQELVELAQRWLRPAIADAQTRADPALRLGVDVGQPDRRLQLAACARIEPYLPTGSRLWGRSRLGMRCVDGPVRWNVSVPFVVSAYGPAWVLQRAVPAGQPIQAADVRQVEVDWARQSGRVLAQPAQWRGQLAARALVPGQVLSDSLVRAARVFQPGAQVRVLARGQGYEISADGQALTAGVVGQSARVRMENGRVMLGTVLDARTVQVGI